MKIPDLGSGVTHLLERLKLGDLLYAKGKGGKFEDPETCYEKSIDLLDEFYYYYCDILDDEEELDDAIEILLELRRLRMEYFDLLGRVRYSLNEGDGKARLKSEEKRIIELKFDILDLGFECSEIINEWCPDIVSLTDELIYTYDYGDDWTVRITCEDAYVLQLDEKSDGYNIVDKNLEPVSGQIREALEKILSDMGPICIAAEGVNVMDDVGGIYGYADFLEELNNCPKDQAREMRAWAREMGWTGRVVKPQNMV